ncbi:MAG: hemolysin III family protein [Solobacterium sp.]|nr:hemolysin III family protein [Solobacterium sp.]
MTVLENRYCIPETIDYRFRVKDPISAATHFAGFIAAILAMPFMMIRCSEAGCTPAEMAACAVYILSMTVLYAASASYHSFHISEKADLILKRIDHTSIFIMITGTYVPICIAGIGGREGSVLLLTVFALAAAGIVYKLFFVTCPKWISSVIYSLLGWISIVRAPVIWHSLGTTGFLWLLAGGIIYTAGSVIYAIKPKFLTGRFSNHDLFHCFVLAGSVCHFITVYRCLVM